MAQRGFGGLTHWGLKPRIGNTSPPPRLKIAPQCDLGKVLGWADVRSVQGVGG